MSFSLRQKTLAGLLWSFIETIARQGIAFIVGVILARLLSPREFGVIGMITIFISVSQAFIDSGFTQAIIRKKDCSQTDLSTVFYFNLAVGILFYLLLFFSAGAISRFFNEPQLKQIVQVLGIGLIFNAFSIIQTAQLIRRIDFKLQTRVSVAASLASGVVGIAMAYAGCGVWSLVVQDLSERAAISLLLWVWHKWKPSWVFSGDSFKELFSFGWKLLVSGLLDTAYRNVFSLIIGKYFSAEALGYYTRADQFRSLPSQNISDVVHRVSYPVLSTMQDDIPRLKAGYKKLIKNTMLITFVLMLGLAAVAKPMVLTLIGEKWLPSVVYLQLLCFSGMTYPLQALNLDILKVLGHSDLFLRLEIIKKALAVPLILIGIWLGIKAMILGMIVASLIAYYLNSYWSGKLIGYSMLEQVKDILPSFLLAATMAFIVYLVGIPLKVSAPLELLIQLALGAGLTVGIAELFHLDNYQDIKGIVIEKVFIKR